MLVAYILGGLLGFLVGEGIYKTLTASLPRRCLSKVWRKKTKIISEDAEKQFDPIKNIADKNRSKLTNFDLRMDFKRK